jgi:hypothetical protein
VKRLGSAALAFLTIAAACVVGAQLGAERASASCAAGTQLGAADLNSAFSKPGLGASGGAQGFGGGDYQHAYPLPNGRVLWLFQDLYFSDDNDLNEPPNNAAHNSGLIEQGSCFTILGTQGRDFIGDAQTIDSERWFWPLDGEIGFDGNLWIFMAEMYNPAGTGASLGALPVKTWLAIIDPDTLQQVYFQPAADAGASPALYGWSITSDDHYSYLYGHCYRQFVHDVNGPGQFDASCMPNSYVARVPLGHFDVQPAYWNGKDWVNNAAAAVPVMSRPIADPVSVQWFGDVWVSVTKAGDWWGSTVFVDVAAKPQGPWTNVQSIPVLGSRKCSSGCANYSAFLLPWLDSNGQLIVAISNGGDYPLWLANAALYRPTFFNIDVPGATMPVSTPLFPTPAGTAGFLAVDPVRLLDTRIAGQSSPRLSKNGLAVLDLHPSGIPTGATAVAFNVTTVDTDSNGFVRVYPCSLPEPATSNVNQVVGRTQTNAAIVPIGSGTICFRSSSAVDLVVDLNGWLTTSSDVGLQPVTSTRLVDTRSGLGGNRRLHPGQMIQVPVVDPASPATAVSLNVTAVDPSLAGYVTVWPCGAAQPNVSNLNPEPLITQPNLVNVRVGSGGTVCLYSSEETDLVVDLLGEYQPGAAARYSALVPQRVLDSRGDAAPRHSSNDSFIVALGSVVAAQVNLTATDAGHAGYLTGYPCLTDQWPGTSNVNYGRDTASANSALLTGSRGFACVYSSTSTNLVVDIFGIWTTPL